MRPNRLGRHQLFEETGLDENATLWTYPDAIKATIIVMAADWLVDRGAFVDVSVERLALIKTKMQFNLFDGRHLSRRRS